MPGMGCCCSFFCKDDNSSQQGDPNERTHLLVDPVSNNANSERVDSEDILCCHSFNLPKKTDEQSAMNRILREAARNMIDVAASGSHNLQQHEYLERIKLYNGNMQQVLGNIRYRCFRKPTCILEDIPNPERVLNSDPISAEDLKLITSSVTAAASAIGDVRVDHKEDVVVPLGLA